MRSSARKVIGARELKTRLGKYLRAVRGGTTITITERGVPVASLGPLSRRGEGMEAVLGELEAEGLLSKGSGEALDRIRPAKVRGEPIDRTIMRNRDDRVVIRYFDSSALAKRYVRAEATPEVNRWLRGARVATCRLTEVELSSAFARRVRDGSMSIKARDAALARLQDDLRKILVVEIAPAVVERVHDLLERQHVLRAADSLQLAAALVLGERVGHALEFIAYDDRLARAARAEGLIVRP